MPQKLMRSNYVRKIIAIVVSFQFLANASSLRALAYDQNLRPQAARDGGRLAEIRKELDTASVTVAKTDTLTPRDGGNVSDTGEKKTQPMSSGPFWEIIRPLQHWTILRMEHL